ncbi:hypothetical protein Bpfe_027598 [Biomphalaria pfeifferi]|uniref:Uncharacterized protein n=1 Tax=Biomphalaria pfeifferi TaxID=112525 RepID=A0AAD8EY21_BIOPF|nr:hypothetical protein Bpfe_027598 [Biomphalaria pfeifferi]
MKVESIHYAMNVNGWSVSEKLTPKPRDRSPARVIIKSIFTNLILLCRPCFQIRGLPRYDGAPPLASNGDNNGRQVSNEKKNSILVQMFSNHP